MASSNSNTSGTSSPGTDCEAHFPGQAPEACEHQQVSVIDSCESAVASTPTSTLLAADTGVAQDFQELGLDGQNGSVAITRVTPVPMLAYRVRTRLDRPLQGDYVRRRAAYMECFTTFDCSSTFDGLIDTGASICTVTPSCLDAHFPQATVYEVDPIQVRTANDTVTLLQASFS